jgi:Rieske Fe-S protein
MIVVPECATRSSADVGVADVVVLNVRGSRHAYRATCPHMGGPLAEGQLEAGVLTCSWHHLQFDAATGQGKGLARLLGLCLQPTAMPPDGGQQHVAVLHDNGLETEPA